jgi:membrane fusion protein (multidrug efflux system)
VSLFLSQPSRYLPVSLLLAGFICSQAVQSNDTAPIRVALVQEQAIQQALQLTGTVTSARSARLSPSTAGLVTLVNVDAGSAVDVGDVLLELDAELAQWEWQGSQASVASAQLARDDAQRRLKEAKALAPKQSIAESLVRDLASEVAEDEAALQRAQADARFRKGVFDRHVLHAPFAGVVSIKHTELGEWVTPGEPVLDLVATGNLRIDFQVSEDYLSVIKPDTELTYTLGDNAVDAREGKIAMLVPVADPGARTFLLRVEPVAPDQRMSPGMSARAVLSLDSGRRGMAVPRDAIIKYPDGRDVVWVVEESERGEVVAEKRVDTGLVFGSMVEVRQGLSLTDRVVVEGNETLQSGQSVTILPTEQR